MIYGILFIAVMGISSVQLIVKRRFDVEHGSAPSDSSIFVYLLNLLSDQWLWFAAIILVLSTLLWYLALSRIYLSTAIAFAALIYPLVMIGSVAFLNEQIALPQALGCALIVCGVWLVASYN